MTTKRGPGRPPAKNPLGTQLMVRLSDDELHQLDELADAYGLTRQQYIRMALVRAHRIAQAGGDPFPLTGGIKSEPAAKKTSKKRNAA